MTIMNCHDQKDQKSGISRTKIVACVLGRRENSETGTQASIRVI